MDNEREEIFKEDLDSSNENLEKEENLEKSNEYVKDNNKKEDNDFLSYVDNIVEKKLEKRNKCCRVKSFSKFLLAVILAGCISSYGTSLYLKSNRGKLLLNQSATDKEAVVINTSESPNVEKAVAKKAMPSVVGITTIGVTEDIFSMQRETSGLGSGVIVSKDGYILTNNHVVNPSTTTSVTVILNDGTKRDAKVLWSDKALDLAVIKINSEGINLKPVEFADSSKVSIGDKAIAIGNPLGINLRSTLTSGYISGKDRVITLKDGSTMEGLLQTDAAINPGNSGGALLNDKGELIGINTAKAGNSDGIGFSIPINIAKPVLDQIIKNGKFEAVVLGIRGIDVARYNVLGKEKLKIETGVYVHEVISGSPAHNGGVKAGDVITKVGDMSITSNSTLKTALMNYKIGDKTKVEVFRDGKTKTLEVSFTQFN